MNYNDGGILNKLENLVNFNIDFSGEMVYNGVYSINLRYTLTLLKWKGL